MSPFVRGNVNICYHDCAGLSIKRRGFFRRCRSYRLASLVALVGENSITCCFLPLRSLLVRIPAFPPGVVRSMGRGFYPRRLRRPFRSSPRAAFRIPAFPPRVMRSVWRGFFRRWRSYRLASLVAHVGENDRSGRFLPLRSLLVRTPRLSAAKKILQGKMPCNIFGGKAGIRTPERVSAVTRFPVVRLRPTQPPFRVAVSEKRV